jgi:hypothetical protein
MAPGAAGSLRHQLLFSGIVAVCYRSPDILKSRLLAAGLGGYLGLGT